MLISVRGPYLSQGDKGHRTPENCSYPSKIQSLSLTLYWNLVFFFFFGHLSVIDRIFLAMTKFFSVTMTEKNSQLGCFSLTVAVCFW